MTNIAILASGSGSNAEQIMSYFEGSESISVVLVATNNPKAYVCERASMFDIPSLCFTRDDFRDPQGEFARQLLLYNVNIIVLAGFLWLVPSYLTTAYAGRIVNIHPALLPAYGGKGMYGDNVHRAVIDAGETQSGITIHHVNEHYDSGDIIHQATCEVEPGDTYETLARKIHELEHYHFPRVIEQVIDRL